MWIMSPSDVKIVEEAKKFAEGIENDALQGTTTKDMLLSMEELTRYILRNASASEEKREIYIMASNIYLIMSALASYPLEIAKMSRIKELLKNLS